MAIIINYSFLPESKFNVYLCNLRWHHNRFQTLQRCYRGIFNFPTMTIWEIDLLGTYCIHADFQTCSICRHAELETPKPIFCTSVTNYILNCHRNKYQQLYFDLHLIYGSLKFRKLNFLS